MDEIIARPTATYYYIKPLQTLVDSILTRNEMTVSTYNNSAL